MPGPPAARISDMHVCPMVTGIIPHVGGPIALGMFTVLTGKLPQARIGDMAVCVGPPDAIAKGSATVLVGGIPAARIGDLTVHGGVIVLGCFTVFIGDAAGGAGSGGAGGAPPPDPTVPGAAFETIAKEVNPLGGTVNCGNIIDAVNDRLLDPTSSATAPVAQDGDWNDIGTRFDTDVTFGHSFDDAYAAVAAGGDGTRAVIGIDYNDGSGISHVVIMANDRGSVGIIEGQNGGAVYRSAAEANAAYNAGGTSDVGIGIIGAGHH